MKPELSVNEKRYSYAKYFDYPQTVIPQEKLDILAAGPMDPAKALPLTQKGKLQEPGDLEVETGYCVAADGTGYVANKTFMPGVTAQMLEWWFVWHSLEDARYKIWDPEGHYYARTQDEKKAMSHHLTYQERIQDSVRDVKFDFGRGPEEMVIEFRKPEEMRYDESLMGTAACATLLCANIRGEDIGKGMPMFMTLAAREAEGGLEVRTHIWIGYQVQWGMPMKHIMRGESVPEEMVKAMFVQNVRKYTRLAAILPQIYEEEKDRF